MNNPVLGKTATRSRRLITGLGLLLCLSSSLHSDSHVTVTYTQDGGVFPTTPPTLVISHGSNDPTLTLTNEAFSMWTGATVVGNLNSESGSLHILNGSAVINNGTGSFIGLYGDMDIYQGMGYIGLNAGSNGSVLVSGQGSSWTNAQELLIGLKGSGYLTISSGGTVTNTGSAIGFETNAYGKVTQSPVPVLPGSTTATCASLTAVRES